MKKLNILTAAVESQPFVSEGRLGKSIDNLIRSYPKRQVDIRVILPKFERIPEEMVENFHYITNIPVKLGDEEKYCGIYEYKKDGITYYFIDNEEYFKRPEIYGYDDDLERFTFFSKAVLDALPYLDFEPEIIHTHDWTTALIPYLFNKYYKEDNENLKTIHTVYNPKYQGLFDLNRLGYLLSDDVSDIEFYDQANFSKAGLTNADLVTVSSPSQAETLKREETGYGLDGIVREIDDKLVGILHGIDESEYNPQTDKNLYENYTRSIKKKLINKEKFQDEYGLIGDMKVPLILITLPEHESDLEIINEVLPDLLVTNIALILADDPEQLRAFEGYKADYPDKVVLLEDTEENFRKGLSASDFVLNIDSLPDSNLSMIAHRYGTVPIVREVGSVVDTVKHFNPVTLEGNGFTYQINSAADLYFAIQKAINLYNSNVTKWNKLLKNTFESHYNWKNTAENYLYWSKKISDKL